MTVPEQLPLGATSVPAWPAPLGGLEAAEHVGGSLAVVLVFGAFLLLPLVVALWLRLRARDLDRAADAARRLEEGADATPEPGHTLVRGLVETGSEPAVRVTIHQTGTERMYKQRWETDWRETRREIAVMPFVLVTASGARVRCLPDPRTRLVDELDGTTRVSLDQRIRTAELTNGERAIVRGRVASSLAAGPGAGYRDPGRELVLQPGPDGMEISTVGLARPLHEAAKLRKTWARVLVIVALVVQLPLVRWHVSLFHGHVEAATVVDTSSRLVKTKNGSRRAYSVTLERTGSERLTVDVVSNDASRLGRGTVVPLRVAALSSTLGAHPSENAWAFFFPGFVLAAALALTALFIHAERPWYERSTLVESRQGRLAEDCPPDLRR